MEKYEDYLDKWLGGLESEIAFWKRYMETKGDIYYDTFKNQTEKDRHFTLERYLDGFSKTEQIKFIDIGSMILRMELLLKLDLLNFLISILMQIVMT